MRADDSSVDTSDVSDLFQRYRECSRHVWNTAFADLPDGWHEFIDVDYALLDALVLKQIVEGRDWRGERETHGCYPSLRVQPQLGPKGINVFWGRERRGGYWPWEERRLARRARVGSRGRRLRRGSPDRTARAIEGWYRARGKTHGIEHGMTGSITVVQRFGSDLAINIHFHSLFLDGVQSVLRFSPIDAPTASEMETLCRTIAHRIARMLERRAIDHDEPEERALLARSRARRTGGAPRRIARSMPMQTTTALRAPAS